MENNDSQFTLKSPIQSNFNNISTPNKEFAMGTPQIKNELFKLIPISPFVNKNNSPQEKSYSYINGMNLKNNSPFIINSSFGPFSPMNINNNNNNNFLETSNNFNKLDSNLNYKIVQKNLMDEFSPYKPKILFNNNSYKNETFERDTYSKGKEMYPFLHCTNLSKKFNALAEQIIKEKNLDFSFNEKEKEKEENSEISNNNNNYSFLINNNNNNFKNEKFFYYNQNNFYKNGIFLEEINIDIEKIKNIFYKNKKKIFSHTLQTLNYNLVEKFSLDSNKFSNNNNNKKNLKFLTTSKKKSSSQKKKNFNLHSTNAKTIRSISTKEEFFPCKCKHSKCLKLYCECFANGFLCKNCNCIDCLNTNENEELRKKTYLEVIQKNPKAIQKIKRNKKSWNCRCKNSNCQKNYCDCFQNGKFCSSKCKCIDCLNKNLNQNKNKKINKKKNEELDYLKTPIKKNYRENNYEIKNNFSTEAYTEMFNSIDQNSINKKKFLSNKKNFCKKLNLDLILDKKDKKINDENIINNNENEKFFINESNKKRKIK